MKNNKLFKTALSFVILISFVVIISAIISRQWNSKNEIKTAPDVIKIESGMTLRQFGEVNGLSHPQLKNIFSLKSKNDLEKNIAEYGSADDIPAMIKKRTALISEESSKNWQKIVIKFTLWFTSLVFIFMFFRKRKVTDASRKIFLFISVTMFGVILGSDPAAMGTVKDAVFLFAKTGAVFPPRMIALTVFLLMVFIANKYICAWGCQAGTLQELIFRINRDEKNKSIILKQIKIPFIVTNTFRILFFLIFTIIAFLWGFDIIEQIDIFRIYKPASLGLSGGLAAGIILVTGLFIYRPWCSLFCPFGLAGWLVEKLSLVKINVDYSTCIACKKCADACPSTVMSAILLDNKKTVPDCFACYSCRDICPTGSIRFSAGKRTKPPTGHFTNNKQ